MNTQKNFDVLILGGGPIATSTLYYLYKNGFTGSAALLTNDTENEIRATFQNSGGSIRTYWDDPIKKQMTEETTQLIDQLSDAGVDLSLHKDSYFFTYTGAYSPARNISAKKLLTYLQGEAVKQGAIIIDTAEITSVTEAGALYTVSTKDTEYTARVVLLGLGIQNETFMPGLTLEHEKRQLFVTNIPVTEENKSMPHTIVKIGNGYAYFFVKQLPEGFRIIVGQEDIIEDDNEIKEVNYYFELMNTELGEILPWLKEAGVERILWGVDAGNKSLRVESNEKGTLMSANCGSAVRGAAYIGRTIAEKISKVL